MRRPKKLIDLLMVPEPDVFDGDSLFVGEGIVGSRVEARSGTKTKLSSDRIRMCLAGGESITSTGSVAISNWATFDIAGEAGTDRAPIRFSKFMLLKEAD